MTVAETKSSVSRRWTVGLLLLLTFVTGLVDAVSFLELGQVFVANMTGNITFLGLSLHPDAHVEPTTPLVALGGFVVGALIAGRVANRFDRAPRRWLPTAFGIEAFVIALVAVLAVALGIQNGTVHHLGVHDLTTTVLTLSLAGVVTDSQIARGPMARPHRRLGSIAAMLAGAGVGALLLFVSLSLVLALAASGTAVVATCFALVGRGAADTDNDQKRNR
ncbi:predicted membrane protein [Saccharomonospora viridis DSM 43017]|uniref:Predicted membrane protein n=1 Tax=Saccharomonospora viridis (strain ATCC 15386 / DSM 43017 / JCM 3036 / CCUG 5913 / NBRC 12207 / NCIMB 9602 / P101) TaxID=471857 RepID=C7MV04_SACVD|nr:predicted membrane protein [Saccharomonospora viridis DSM 43017]